MNNGDKQYLHMVVKSNTYGFAIQPVHTLCTTNDGFPGVFADAAHAELLASQYRDIDPHGTYRVLQFVVL